MAIKDNDNRAVMAPKPSDDRYINGTALWASTTEVLANIPTTRRYPGLTVRVAGPSSSSEYWWEDDVTDDGLKSKVYVYQNDWIKDTISVEATSTSQLVVDLPSTPVLSSLSISVFDSVINSDNYTLSGNTLTITGFDFVIGFTYEVNYKYQK